MVHQLKITGKIISSKEAWYISFRNSSGIFVIRVVFPINFPFLLWQFRTILSTLHSTLSLISKSENSAIYIQFSYFCYSLFVIPLSFSLPLFDTITTGWAWIRLFFPSGKWVNSLLFHFHIYRNAEPTWNPFARCFNISLLRFYSQSWTIHYLQEVCRNWNCGTFNNNFLFPMISAQKFIRKCVATNSEREDFHCFGVSSARESGWFPGF